MEAIVDRLKDTIEGFNDRNVTPYKLSISVGYDVFHRDSKITTENFVTRVDDLMYRQKESKKLCNESV